jgi:two-component system nitrate/nitrite response regulator NarL
MSKSKPTKILLVDDHPFVREGIRSFLSDYPEFDVFAEASSAEEAIEKIKASPPDLVLMDLNLPGMQGLKATELIRAWFPNIKVVVLTAHDSKEYVVRLAKAGAHGYILKGAPPTELLEIIRNVLAGRLSFSSKVSGYLVQSSSTSEQEPLSEREVDVLICAAQGLTLKQTAEKLKVAPYTVQTYRARISEKLGTHNLTDLIKYALSKGYIKLES